MELKKITLKGYFNSFSGPRADKSAKVAFITQELPDNEIYKTFADLKGTFGTFTFQQESEEKVTEDNA